MEEDILNSVIENQIDSLISNPEPETNKTVTIQSVEEVRPVHITKTTTTRKKDYNKPMNEIKLNKIEIIFSNEPIEMVNLVTATTTSIVPKFSGKLKLSNTNLYRIPITNKEYFLDNFYTIKQYAKFAEYFRIVSVANGKVSIAPIISGLELKSGDVIGELI